MENNNTPTEKMVSVPESRLNDLVNANEELKADLTSLIKNVNTIAEVVNIKKLQSSTSSLMMTLPGIMRKLNGGALDQTFAQLTSLTEKYGLQV